LESIGLSLSFYIDIEHNSPFDPQLLRNLHTDDEPAELPATADDLPLHVNLEILRHATTDDLRGREFHPITHFQPQIPRHFLGNDEPEGTADARDDYRVFHVETTARKWNVHHLLVPLNIPLDYLGLMVAMDGY